MFVFHLLFLWLFKWIRKARSGLSPILFCSFSSFALAHQTCQIIHAHIEWDSVCVCVCDISTICKCIESDELSTISILWLLLLLAMSFISSCFLSFVVLFGYFFVCLIRRPVLPWSMRFHFLFNSNIFFAVLLRYFVSLLCFSFPLSVSFLAPNQLLRLFCLCKQIMVCLLVSFKWHNPNNSNYKEDEEQNKK